MRACPFTGCENARATTVQRNGRGRAFGYGEPIGVAVDWQTRTVELYRCGVRLQAWGIGACNISLPPGDDGLRLAAYMQGGKGMTASLSFPPHPVDCMAATQRLAFAKASHARLGSALGRAGSATAAALPLDLFELVGVALTRRLVAPWHTRHSMEPERIRAERAAAAARIAAARAQRPAHATEWKGWTRGMSKAKKQETSGRKNSRPHEATPPACLLRVPCPSFGGSGSSGPSALTCSGGGNNKQVDGANAEKANQIH